jgi:hypothetical protein
MMNETVFLGGCPVIRPEGIYLNGRRVIRLGLGDVGDLFAYRQEWEPFIAAHLALWREMNNRFENSSDVTKCPPGIFTNAQIPKTLDPVWQSWCASLALTRKMVSTTDPDGILPRWNAWANKSSAEVLAGAADMLTWHQEVVMSVGGPDKNRLLENAKMWGIDVKLPDLPTFSTQQDIIARIQGAYVTTKGILQILGYGAGEAMVAVGDVAQATAQGLSDTAKALPSTTKWIGIAAAVAVVLVGGALVVYYHPRRPEPPPRALPYG